MGPSESIDQIVGILDRNGFEFERRGDGNTIAVDLDGVTVFAGAQQIESSVYVHIWTHLALDVTMTPEVAAGAYLWVNQQNIAHAFAKFGIYEGTGPDDMPTGVAQIDIEHDLLANELQAAEFINSVERLADASRETQDNCIQLFGGVILEEKIAQLEAEAEAESGDA